MHVFVCQSTAQNTITIALYSTSTLHKHEHTASVNVLPMFFSQVVQKKTMIILLTKHIELINDW